MPAFLITLAFLACKGDEDPPPAGGGDTGTLPLNEDCSQYEYDGVVYNCDILDPCTEIDIAYWYACSQCDPSIANPDPDECEGAPPPPPPPPEGAESCMTCHNGDTDNNTYDGDGLTNPHPFGSAAYISCTTCHGGDGTPGNGKEASHVPNPPDIGDDNYLINNEEAYFNFLTLTGVDKFEDYEVDGVTYTGLDWLRFRNPGDLRVVSTGVSCGQAGCHGGEHVDWVVRNPLATEVGFYSATLYTSGVDNAQGNDWYQDTAGDYGFRAVVDPGFTYTGTEVGRVGELYEFPEYATWGDTLGIYQNPDYDVDNLAADLHDGQVQEANRIRTGSNMEHLVTETVAFFCGDCHLGSAGANNRYADFRSSGCTSCHMEYSPDGKSRSTDPNVNKVEPVDPDAIAAPERPHIEAHQIRNVSRILPGLGFVRGISDQGCAGCHQGSNRTVLQYWGIRLDQNQDLTNLVQYPDNPDFFLNAAGDTRLFDPGVGNNTFNGRIAEQLILEEDYDADGRDDTPPDVHYEAGLGCIDCHGSYDVHAGTEGAPDYSGRIMSREDQAMGVQCESCHGTETYYAETTACTDYDGLPATCATDRLGNPLRNVTYAAGDYWLRSRVDGDSIYVPQSKDTVDQGTDALHPIDRTAVYNPLASYAMGRYDGDPSTGTGPEQQDYLVDNDFAHSDNLECVSCHASWTNSCVGCHLALEYDDNPANYFFSNTTGERISVFGSNADFVYQSPILMTIGVGTRGKITQTQPGMKMFFRYTDLNGDESQVFAFTDRNGNGNNPNVGGRGAFGALAHNKIMPHSVRGKVDQNYEGPRYCVTCHLTTDALDNFGDEYAQFRADLQDRNYANLDYDLLQEHIGRNTGNQLNSPFFVHMAAGLGTGLFAFDEFGCPVNPLDNDDNRQYCADGAPADNFDADNIVYDLDRVVEEIGAVNASNAHPMLDGLPSPLRVGANNQYLSGPLGRDLLYRLTDPDQANVILLDGWLNADGEADGTAPDYIDY